VAKAAREAGPGFYFHWANGEKISSVNSVKPPKPMEEIDMNTNTQGNTEKLNMLAAGLLTAIAVHVLMCIATLPGIVASSTDASISALALKSARILWQVLGTAGGIFVAVQAVGLVNGNSLRQARVGAIGALALPFLGSIGAVTAFALVPLGLYAVLTLRSSESHTLFRDGHALEALSAQ
jgi:hypothetical protein